MTFPRDEYELESFLKEFGEAHDRAIDWLNASFKADNSIDKRIANLQYKKSHKVCGEVLERINRL